jgi:hypothetical protein
MIRSIGAVAIIVSVLVLAIMLSESF